MSAETFHSLKTRVREIVNLYDNNCAYIRLTVDTWIPYGDFMRAAACPEPLANFECDIAGCFGRDAVGAWVLPDDFAIVFHDGNWVSYNYCWEDTRCSTFLLNVIPVKPPFRYGLGQESDADDGNVNSNKKRHVDEDRRDNECSLDDDECVTDTDSDHSIGYLTSRTKKMKLL